MIRLRISAGREVKEKTCCWGGSVAMTVVGGKEREKDECSIDGSILWFMRRRWFGLVEDVSDWRIATVGREDCVCD